MTEENAQSTAPVHAVVMRLARRIQAIEHAGHHTWESCHEMARQRAIRQASACFEEMNLGRLVDAFEQLPADVVTDPAMEELGGLIVQLSHDLESV